MSSLTVYTQNGYWDANGINPNYPWLFVGSLSAAEATQEQLQNHYNVTRILTVARDLPVQISSSDNKKIQHLQVDLDDHPYANLLEISEECCNFIDQAEADATATATATTTTIPSSNDDDCHHYCRQQNSCCWPLPPPPNILVHCASGSSRSVSIVMIWLMTRKHYKLNEALEIIRENRSIADPNDGFIQQLKLVELCCGSIRKANFQYIESIQKSNAEEIQHQIKIANDLHRNVDELEIQIQQYRSSISIGTSSSDSNVDAETTGTTAGTTVLITGTTTTTVSTTAGPPPQQQLQQKHNTKESLLRQSNLYSDQLDNINNQFKRQQPKIDNKVKIILKATRNKLERLILTLEEERPDSKKN